MPRSPRLSVVAAVALAWSCAGPGQSETKSTSAPSKRRDRAEREAADRPGERVDLPLERTAAEADGEVGTTLEILGEAVERSMEGLADREYAPYFVSYQISEVRTRSASASFGAIESADPSRRRMLDLDVRVGDYELDNTHKLRGQFRRRYRRTHRIGFPLAGASAAARSLWRATDARYRRAVERYKKVRANQSISAPEEDDSADFTRRDALRHVESEESLGADLSKWKKRIRRLSAVFADFDALTTGSVHFRERIQNRYQANSEGSRVRKVRHTAHLSWYVATTAEDGMKLRLYDSVDVFDPSDLPAIDELESRVRKTAERLAELREAPKSEPFVGPAILEAEAAGVFFHEALGHRVEGHRQIDASEGQTFREKVGERVLPEFLDVYDDPRLTRADETALMGHYRVDDQAVPAERATLVRRGRLKGFLMARTPFGQFESSNGHGRRQAGKRIVARQGNLVVHPRETVPPGSLKERLLEEVERQDAPYGLRFVRVQGGFTMTRRFFPQSFRVLPLVVYRVYPDGREELVRGVQLEGTPLTALSNIVAAGGDMGVFNGMCGAESGRVPVSAVSPSLLIERVETARSRKGSDRPPILPPPDSKSKPPSNDTEGAN